MQAVKFKTKQKKGAMCGERAAPVDFSLFAAHSNVSFVDPHGQGSRGAGLKEFIRGIWCPVHGFVGGKGGGVGWGWTAAASPSAAEGFEI
jgi:hypothetical protein